jgi:thiosulfate dehydrogenase
MKWGGVILCTFTMGTTDLVPAAAPAVSEPVPQRRNLQSPKLDPGLVKREAEEIKKVVKRGDDLWHDRNLGTNGLACNMCHPDATVTHPETYPKFKTQFGRVITAQEMINWCIQVPLQGKGFPIGSPDLTALEAYMNDQNKGQVMEVGLPSP